jgi:hypothetical protein
MKEHLQSLFPMPKNPFNPDEEIWSEGMTEILLAQNKSGGKPMEKPQQPKQGKDVKQVIARKMKRIPRRQQ